MKTINNLLFTAVLSLLTLKPSLALGKATIETIQQSVSTQEGIQFFQGSFQQAQEEAKKHHKPLFVDFYATWWVLANEWQRLSSHKIL